MYAIFTYILLFLMVKYGKWRQIYHTWMLWVLVDPVQFLAKKFQLQRMDQAGLSESTESLVSNIIQPLCSVPPWVMQGWKSMEYICESKLKKSLKRWSFLVPEQSKTTSPFNTSLSFRMGQQKPRANKGWKGPKAGWTVGCNTSAVCKSSEKTNEDHKTWKV